MVTTMKNNEMKKLLYVLTIILFLTSCIPSQAQIEQAIAETQVAMPTETLTPEPTRTPTLRPTKTTSPTSTIDIKATQLQEARLKEKFANDMKELLTEKYGCALANWEEKSFELVCAKAVGWNDAEQLKTLVYTMTLGSGIRMSKMGLGHLFEPDFNFVVILLSDDAKTAVKATTDGETMRKLTEEEIASQLEWEVFAKIEIKTQ